MTKSVRHHKIVKGGKLQKSESSLICVVIAEGSSNALPVSAMNSMATCSTWGGMGCIRLYLARHSPYDENKQPYHTGSVAFRRTPGQRCQVCYWCIIEDSWKDNITISTWNTRTLRAAGTPEGESVPTIPCLSSHTSLGSIGPHHRFPASLPNLLG